MGHTRTRREMRFTAQIGEFEMDEVILDLGSKVNVLTKQTWEQMGSPKLARSPIHLRLANQQRVSPLGRLLQVPVDIDGVRSFADFEVIEIIGDSRSYPDLLGIDWAFDNMVVINLKKRQMNFEDKQIRVIAPLDPFQGPRYIEPIRAEEEVHNMERFYQMTANQSDYINPTTEGNISWRCDRSCASDSDVGLENW